MRRQFHCKWYHPSLDQEKLPVLIKQSFFNDLVRDLNLPKGAAELLGSRLHHNNIPAPGTTFSFYRRRKEGLVPYFSMDDTFMFCRDIGGLLHATGCVYDPKKWRLFIDSLKASLKCVLLHNDTASVQIGHSVHLKETYENMKISINKIKYFDHNWLICGDLKILCMLLGQQGGYTMCPCFLCLWNSRAKTKHWEQKQWPERKEFTPGEKNLLNQALVDPSKVLLPPLNIKLSLMKQYVKILDKHGACFGYICQKFLALSNKKLKTEIFAGPKIRQLMKDKKFIETINQDEKED